VDRVLAIRQEDDDPMDSEEQREQGLKRRRIHERAERQLAIAAYNAAEGRRTDEFPEPDTNEDSAPVPDSDE
jgi:hypothetical protein